MHSYKLAIIISLLFLYIIYALVSVWLTMVYESKSTGNSSQELIYIGET